MNKNLKNLKNVLTMDNKELGLKVRTIKNEDGKILFVANDIAKALGYKRPADAVTTHCKGVCILPTPTKGGMQQVKFIPEGDIIRLSIKSKLPGADRFESWIFDEVIPSVLKNGGYINQNATKEQVQKLNNKWAKKSIYLTDEIHDRKSIRKHIRNYDMMKLDECIDTIAEMTNKMKGDIKHELLDVAIAELKKIDEGLMKDTIKHTYIKDTAIEGIIILQDVKIGKYKRKLNRIIA